MLFIILFVDTECEAILPENQADKHYGSQHKVEDEREGVIQGMSGVYSKETAYKVCDKRANNNGDIIDSQYNGKCHCRAVLRRAHLGSFIVDDRLADAVGDSEQC